MVSVDYPEEGNEWCAAVEDDSWWFQHRNRVLTALTRRFPPATPLYDVGGGNGVVAAALRDAGIEAIVVEPGEAGVRNARARGLQAIHATLGETAAALPAGSLGSIGLFDVVEHIEDDAGFLAHAFAMLRPGGRMYVTVPAYQTLWSAEDIHARHVRRYTARSLRRVLRAAGLEVEHAAYMFFFLPLPLLLFRTIPHRLGRARAFSEQGVRDDHGGGGFSRAALGLVLNLELRAIRMLGGLPFGGSVVAVARKPSS